MKEIYDYYTPRNEASIYDLIYGISSSVVQTLYSL